MYIGRLNTNNPFRRSHDANSVNTVSLMRGVRGGWGEGVYKPITRSLYKPAVLFHGVWINSVNYRNK